MDDQDAGTAGAAEHGDVEDVGGVGGVAGAPEDHRRARRRHDEVLATIARVAGSSLDLQEVLERIVERAAALTGADRSSIWLLDRSRRLIPSALFGMDPGFTEGWKQRPLSLADEPLSREVIDTGCPLAIDDAAGDPRTDKLSVEFFGDKSILVAPLVSRGRVLGTLFINHVAERYRFSDGDVATAAAIANQAAIAIDNARLYGDTRRLAQQLHRSFRHAGEALAASVDVGRNLELMLQLAAETVDALGGAIELLEEGGRDVYTAASTGVAPAADNFRAEFPLVAGGRPLGSLALWRNAPDFSAEERELLTAFAGHARSAIEHARLYASLQEERARAHLAERTQAEFSSMVSHELRTPLALIKGYVSTLLNPPATLSPERGRRYIEGIDVAADRLRRLIDNMLSANRVESALFQTDPRPLEVHALVRAAVQAAGLLAEGRRIEVGAVPEELWVLGDADQLTQVLENLIGNAIKHAPGDSAVGISAQPLDGLVRLSVVDAGPGIPPEALDLIFQKFYRVVRRDSEGAIAERPPTAGLGLGLYICRRIVEAHGGRIWAENLPQGGGAFHVELPARARGEGA